MAFYAGCFLLLLLATDRYIAISKPLKHLTNRYRKILSGSLWTLWTVSFIIGIWQAFVHNVGPSYDVPSYNLCGAKASIATSIFTPLTALFCIIPFLFTVTINIIISVKLIRREKERIGAGCPGCRLQGGFCTNHLNISKPRDKPDISQLMKMKSVRMTVIVAFCLFVSQAPVCILYTLAWKNPKSIGKRFQYF
ncbi:olfactory receptor 2M4 isoform X1 [Eurytemora carolleeae]|uniref:olfactory receptor 2M4 isoform X1 n=1 Tax=Eurytemora carolleeae TaxID=1294199 RepID=UPI000C75D1A5|nr:olfactory receptor 2M4 isoform X1 [Eurytemora carolleeae]|eukprot:XP_023324550.1 olfactory receptor 2M4-like isoform X1 [Eurytemora affinis]